MRRITLITVAIVVETLLHKGSLQFTAQYNVIVHSCLLLQSKDFFKCDQHGAASVTDSSHAFPKPRLRR
jgi:hypothetical protein